MKVLETSHQNWESQGGRNPVSLPLNPDKFVIDCIENNLKKFRDDLTLVKLWFSKLYHDHAHFSTGEFSEKAGIQKVQTVIDNVCQYQNKNYVFVCGHIIVNQLEFYGNRVLSYHGIKGSAIDTIPMPPFVFSEDRPETSCRKYLASFAGSFDTHWTRHFIFESLRSRDDCYVNDTGVWHYYSSSDGKDDREDIYKNLLKDSAVTICPRGTGPCTIRLWESLASGSVPLVVSDAYKFPQISGVDWNTCVLTLPESRSDAVSEFLDELNLDDIQDMQRHGTKLYNDYVRGDRIIHAIEGILNNE